MRVRHSVIVLAVYAISITLWTVVQQNTLRKRDVQIQVLSDDNENLKLSVHKYMTRQQSDHRALKRCETELEPVKRALFQSQAIAYRCEKLMKCELRPEFQPESLKRKFILKKARALQLLHAVQSLDVEGAQAEIEHATELLERHKITERVWFLSEFNPLMLTTTTGQNLLHVAIMSTFIRDGHGVGIMSTWVNPMKYELRHKVIDQQDNVAVKIVRAILKAAPQLALETDIFGTTPLHTAAYVGTRKIANALAERSTSLHLPVDINAQDHNGHTPLHKAVINGHTEIERILRAHGAKDDISDNGGHTVRSILARQGVRLGSRASTLGRGRNTQRRLSDHSSSFKSQDPGFRRSDLEEMANCTETGGWKIIRDDEMPCDIDEVDARDITPEQWYNNYYLSGKPLVVRNYLSLSERCILSKQNVMDENFFLREKSVGPSAYPGLTGQKACEAHMTIEDMEKGEHCYEDDYEVVPNMVFKKEAAALIPKGWMSETTAALPFLEKPWVSAASFQLFVGGTDSGAAMHFHGTAYNVVFFGQKHWRFLPPRHAALSGIPSKDYFSMFDNIKKYNASKAKLTLSLPPPSHGPEQTNLEDDVYCTIPVTIPDITAGKFRVEAVVETTEDYKGPSQILSVRCIENCDNFAAASSSSFRKNGKGVEQHLAYSLTWDKSTSSVAEIPQSQRRPMVEALMEVNGMTEQEAMIIVSAARMKAFPEALERGKALKLELEQAASSGGVSAEKISAQPSNRSLAASKSKGTAARVEVLLGPRGLKKVTSPRGAVSYISVRAFGPVETEHGRRSDLIVNSEFFGRSLGTADETMPKSSSDSIANFMHSPEWFQTNQRTSLKNQCVMPELWHFTSDVDRNVPAKTCTQNPGDLLLLPAQWGHATYNPSFVIGFGNLWNDKDSGVMNGGYSPERSVSVHAPAGLFWSTVLGRDGLQVMDTHYNDMRKRPGFAVTGGRI